MSLRDYYGTQEAVIEALALNNWRVKYRRCLLDAGSEWHVRVKRGGSIHIGKSEDQFDALILAYSKAFTESITSEDGWEAVFPEDEEDE
jgi:hypothetical protein